MDAVFYLVFYWPNFSLESLAHLWDLGKDFMVVKDPFCFHQLYYVRLDDEVSFPYQLFAQAFYFFSKPWNFEAKCFGTFWFEV